MKQSDIVMPRAGEVWKHYKGGEYKIIGLSYNAEGFLEVVYTKDGDEMFNRPLHEFLQTIDLGIVIKCATNISRREKTQRFVRIKEVPIYDPHKPTLDPAYWESRNAGELILTTSTGHRRLCRHPECIEYATGVSKIDGRVYCDAHGPKVAVLNGGLTVSDVSDALAKAKSDADRIIVGGITIERGEAERVVAAYPPQPAPIKPRVPRFTMLPDVEGDPFKPSRDMPAPDRPMCHWSGCGKPAAPGAFTMMGEPLCAEHRGK